MRAAAALSLTTAALVALLSACGGSAEPNEADVRFATEMVPHHEQAVEMSELAETRASGAQVRALAEDIEGAQDPEIETMTGWLREWGEEVPSGHDRGGEPMAGMLTDSELDRLSTLSGAAFDRAYLDGMKRHHEGAITMAREQQRDGRLAEVSELAEEIETTQTREIATIDRLLGP